MAQHITSDFNQLFDLISTIDRPMYVQGNPIIVIAITKNSQLTSTPTIQSISKKSIVKKILQERYFDEQSEEKTYKKEGDFSLHSK